MIRRLKITPELWIDLLKYETPVIIRIARNALPSDARCVGWEMDESGYMIGLWVESGAFRPDDPIDLDAPLMQRIDA